MVFDSRDTNIQYLVSIETNTGSERESSMDT